MWDGNIRIYRCRKTISSENVVCQSQSQSQSQSYFTADSLPPISSSWQQAPWDSRLVILFVNWTLVVIVFMSHPLWREDGSVVYSCCWSSPAQSFSGPSPAGLMTTFYCLRFETPPTWRARSPYLYPPGKGWPGNERLCSKKMFRLRIINY
jgi:hypothetical protein